MNNKNNNEDFYLIDKVNERNQDAFKVLMIIPTKSLQCVVGLC